MRVVGLSGGAPVVLAEVGQGVHPYDALLSQGWMSTRPLHAHLAPDGELELVVQAEPTGHAPARQRPPGRDPDLVVRPGEQPVVRQRIAAYALVRSTRGVLATEYSAKTSAKGRWGLPGGGIDPGEEPVDTVVREVMEETSQVAIVHELIDVHSAHWIGRAPSHNRHGTTDVLEDYHAIRLIYRAECDEPTEPVVIDVGGTTESARWVAADAWTSLGWTAGWHAVMSRVLGERTPTDRAL